MTRTIRGVSRPLWTIQGRINTLFRPSEKYRHPWGFVSKPLQLIQTNTTSTTRMRLTAGEYLTGTGIRITVYLISTHVVTSTQTIIIEPM